MNWFKENPFLAGLIVVTVIAAGALGYLVSQEMGRAQLAGEGYAQAVQKLHGLQERVPYPNEKNLAVSREQSEQYRKDLRAVREQLAAMELPLNPSIDARKFQDDLRMAVNETATKAQAAGVVLPPGFYLGFGQYANSLPSEQAAPHLARQLALIKQLVQQLIDFKIKSLDALTRKPLPQENPAAAQPAATPAPEQGGRSRRQNAGGGDKEKVFDRYPFDIAFTAEQSKFRLAFNALLNSNQFLIVRAVEIQNSNVAGPPVAAASAAPAAVPAEEAPKALNVILGQELVRAGLRIEILDFPDMEAPAR